MIRVTTIYAASAGASARYYTGYLTKSTGELPGRWTGCQASAFGLGREVSTEALESLLSGRHPITGQVLGREAVLDARRQRLEERAAACEVELDADGYVFSRSADGDDPLHRDMITGRSTRARR